MKHTLVGYANGTVDLWDFQSRDFQKNLYQASPGSAINDIAVLSVSNIIPVTTTEEGERGSLSINDDLNLDGENYEDGYYIAIATDENVVLMDANNLDSPGVTHRAFPLPEKHNGGIHRVCFDPSGRYLATCGFDGCVGIWEVDRRRLNARNVWFQTVMNKENRDFKNRHQLGGISWCPRLSAKNKNIPVLALPGNKNVSFVTLDTSSKSSSKGSSTWIVYPLFENDADYHGHQDDIYLTTWSPSGTYLATVGMDNICYLWDVKEIPEFNMSRTEFSNIHSKEKQIGPLCKCLIDKEDTGRVADVAFLNEKKLVILTKEGYFGVTGSLPYLRRTTQLKTNEKHQKVDNGSVNSITTTTTINENDPDSIEGLKRKILKNTTEFELKNNEKDQRPPQKKAKKNHTDLKLIDGIATEVNDDDKDVEEEDNYDRSQSQYDANDDDIDIDDNDDNNDDDENSENDEYLPDMNGGDDMILDPYAARSGKSSKTQHTTMGGSFSEMDILLSLQKVFPVLQQPFVPSSSPLHYPSRYLCWNRVGSITRYDLETDPENPPNPVLEIIFNDYGLQKPRRIPDIHNMVFAALSVEGALFANAASLETIEKGDEEDEDELHQSGSALYEAMKEAEVSKKNKNNKKKCSSIYYRPFDSQWNTTQWLYTLPPEETPLGVACGTSFAAVATSKQFLRLFTISGLQNDILMLPGPIVTMSGQGDFLFYVYHAEGSMPFFDFNQRRKNLIQQRKEIKSKNMYRKSAVTQVLTFTLLNVKQGIEIMTKTLPLTPGSSLKWCGFTDCGLPAIMDTQGQISILRQRFGWQWLPILNAQDALKNPKTERIWPISIHDMKVECIILKSINEEAPPTRPKPLPSKFPFTVPLVPLTDRDNVLNTFNHDYMVNRALLSQRQTKIGNTVAENAAEGTLISKEAEEVALEGLKVD